MKPRNLALAAVVLIVASCAEPPIPAEQQFVAGVAAALGGSREIEAVTTFSLEAEGRMLNVGQDLTPEAATMEFVISDYRMQADLANERSRTELVRTPLFDYFRGQDPMRLISGIDGEVAYDIGPDGGARRAHERAAEDRRSAYYHHPLPLLRAVLTGSAMVDNLRDEGGLSLADITMTTGKTYTLAVDAATRQPTYIKSTDHHPYLRDAVRTTEFFDYASAGALTLPTVISQAFEEFHVVRLEATAQSPNAAIDDISAPPEAATAAPITGTPPAQVTVEQLADGVWFLTGQSHHSVLFEFEDHLKLLEAPNEVRTLAVIAAAEELVPEKPVTHIINTHHHFDHSGGVRVAVSEGLTIVTHAANEAFYRRMAEQPSTLVPDALSASPRPIQIETVTDSRTYQDAAMTLELYHVAGSAHSSSILMTYLPEHRLLIQADLYNPGRTTPQLFAPNLLENVRRHDLEVDRLVPIHGGIVDFEVLVEAVAALQN